MKARTTKEIEKEIEALQECKSYVARESLFGDDNHRNIDLQIEELEYGIDDTAAEWDEFSMAEQDAIMEARNWKEGEEKDSPSSGWDYLKPKAKKK